MVLIPLTRDFVPMKEDRWTNKFIESHFLYTRYYTHQLVNAV